MAATPQPRKSANSDQAPDAPPASAPRSTGRRMTLPLLLAAVYLAIYLIGQLVYAFGFPEYLFRWLVDRKLYWFAAAITILPACFGAVRFGITTLIGFVVGLLAGILFGPNPAGAPYGMGHYGWAIWIVIFGISIILGLILQLMKRIKGEKP